MCAKTKAKPASTPSGGEKVVTVNRKAFHDYFIEEDMETGIQLTGTEIKSIRDGRVNLRDGYARIQNGEVWLHGMHISPYEHSGAYFQHDPLRPKKLLLHRKQIDYLQKQTETAGYTLIPLRLVLRRGRGKICLLYTS
ncbi:MAG TPA: SsrA-binding protein, partial [Chloroflexi bacterium]|nr:SsrA-binding protein [Chloroflexota bacterium]